MLALALLTGLVLRFYRLDDVSISVDESSSWMAAAEPVRSLLHLQPLIDAGKLAIYDLLLHYWIVIFGDGLSAMRAFSAAIDTVSIVLMFALVRELYQAFAEENAASAELAGGFAALLFATNVLVVQSARAARMYPLMTAFELAEILFFIRAQRRERLSDCILTALFLALAIAANFTAALILVSQVFWLAYLWLARARQLPGAQLRVAGPAISLVAGILLLLPWKHQARALLRQPVRDASFGWIVYQSPIRWSWEVLRSNVGDRWLFVLLLAMIALAIWRHRRRGPLLPTFLAATIVGPFAAIGLASLFGVRMMVDRYVLIALIAFLGFASVGAASFESALGRAAVLLSIIILSLQALNHSSAFWIDWRQAAAIAAETPDNTEIGVVPTYGIHAVQYHLPIRRRPLATKVKSQCGNPNIIIVSPSLISATSMSALATCYPRLLGQATAVEIRSR